MYSVFFDYLRYVIFFCLYVFSSCIASYLLEINIRAFFLKYFSMHGLFIILSFLAWCFFLPYVMNNTLVNTSIPSYGGFFQSVFFYYCFVPLFLIHLFTDYIEQMLYLIVSGLLFLMGIIMNLLCVHFTQWGYLILLIMLKIFLIGVCFQIIKKIASLRHYGSDGIGSGDVILICALTPWISSMMLLYSVGIGSFLGSLYLILRYGYHKAQNYQLSFAPFIFIGILISGYVL